MKNILFEKLGKGIFICKSPDNKDVFFDVKHEPSIAIIDSNQEKLKNTVGGFVKSLTEDGSFELVVIDDGCMPTENNVIVFDYTEFDAVISRISNEIESRYKLFNNHKFKNIND